MQFKTSLASDTAISFYQFDKFSNHIQGFLKALLISEFPLNKYKFSPFGSLIVDCINKECLNLRVSTLRALIDEYIFDNSACYRQFWTLLM